jgi:hypothetical protein
VTTIVFIFLQVMLPVPDVPQFLGTMSKIRILPRYSEKNHEE